jgi:hypothetical protein
MIMAWRRFGVVQGRTHAALFAILLWVGACGDSSVSFGPDVGQGDDDDDTGGSSPVAGTGNGSSGSSTTAGTGTSAGTGPDEGGAGNDTGGTDSGGTTSGGKAGSNSGGASAGSGGANVSGSGGTGGSAGSGNESGAGGNGGGGTANGGTGGSGAGGNGGSGGSPPVTCTTGSAFGHNYAFCTEVESAMAGYEKCQSLGMSVVTIESKLENDYVLGKQKGTWLGGTDEGHEKDWIWATGVYFTKNDKPVQGVYSNWLDGQPNNDNKDGLNENCLVMTSTGGWNDLACTLGGSKVTCESSGPSIPMP